MRMTFVDTSHTQVRVTMVRMSRDACWSSDTLRTKNHSIDTSVVRISSTQSELSRTNQCLSSLSGLHHNRDVFILQVCSDIDWTQWDPPMRKKVLEKCRKVYEQIQDEDRKARRSKSYNQPSKQI